MIKIAAKNGVADLEFGISGQPWKIRSGHKIEFKKSKQEMHMTKIPEPKTLTGNPALVRAGLDELPYNPLHLLQNWFAMP